MTSCIKHEHHSLPVDAASQHNIALIARQLCLCNIGPNCERLPFGWVTYCSSDCTSIQCCPTLEVICYAVVFIMTLEGPPVTLLLNTDNDARLKSFPVYDSVPGRQFDSYTQLKYNETGICFYWCDYFRT